MLGSIVALEEIYTVIYFSLAETGRQMAPRIRVTLGSNNTVEYGSEVGFKTGNGIVAEEGGAEVATRKFTLRGRGCKRRGGRRGTSFSMKLPQQVCNLKFGMVWNCLIWWFIRLWTTISIHLLKIILIWDKIWWLTPKVQLLISMSTKAVP